MPQNKKHLPIRRKLRRDTTASERLLWSHLRSRQLGFDFRRQHSIGPYIVDFYCAKARLVVEVDGITHSGQDAESRDRERDDFLLDCDYEVLRFPTQDVMEYIEGVCIAIRAKCRERVGFIPPPVVPPFGGDGEKRYPPL
jgi:very-short-patch-repair endonuclease